MLCMASARLTHGDRSDRRRTAGRIYIVNVSATWSPNKCRVPRRPAQADRAMRQPPTTPTNSLRHTHSQSGGAFYQHEHMASRLFCALPVLRTVHLARQADYPTTPSVRIAYVTKTAPSTNNNNNTDAREIRGRAGGYLGYATHTQASKQINTNKSL
ncbi:hypothetical protein BC567DRAFT_99005 [Phyllosticta citribraziliensis]